MDVGEKHPSVASHMPPTGGLACNPGMCPHWELNQQTLSLWEDFQPTEPHQSQPHRVFLNLKVQISSTKFVKRLLFCAVGARHSATHSDSCKVTGRSS